MTQEDLETRDRILDAAEQAFADSGYAGARVNAIAAAAGANKAMIYYYFKSKEGLYRAVLERTFDLLIEQLSAHIEQAPQADVLAFLRGYRSVIRAHPSMSRLIMRDLADGGANVISTLVPRFQRVMGSMGAALQAGQAEGRVNPDIMPMIATPVLIAPFVLFSMVSPMMSAATGLPPEALTDPFDQTAEAILLNGLLCPPENP